MEFVSESLPRGGRGDLITPIWSRVLIRPYTWAQAQGTGFKDIFDDPTQSDGSFRSLKPLGQLRSSKPHGLGRRTAVRKKTHICGVEERHSALTLQALGESQNIQPAKTLDGPSSFRIWKPLELEFEKAFERLSRILSTQHLSVLEYWS